MRAAATPGNWRGPGGVPAGPPQQISRPVSRVLWGTRRSPVRDGHSSGTPVTRRFEQPTRTAGFGHRSGTRRLATMRPAPSLFGFAPGGVCHAIGVAADAVRSYRTISPLPRLTPRSARRGGLFSVALSLGSPPPDVIRHRMSMEPGLSSPATFRPLPERPSSRLTQEEWGGEGRRQGWIEFVDNNAEGACPLPTVTIAPEVTAPTVCANRNVTDGHARHLIPCRRFRRAACGAAGPGVRAALCRGAVDPRRACAVGAGQPLRRRQSAVPRRADPDRRRDLVARGDAASCGPTSRSARPNSRSATSSRACSASRSAWRWRRARSRARRCSRGFPGSTRRRPSRSRRCSFCGSASASGRRWWW